MPKFYVQVGPLQLVQSADCAEEAAQWAIDRVMRKHVWIYDDPGMTDADRHDHLMLEAILHLDPEARVSEQGFDRADCTYLGTPELVEQWHSNRRFTLRERVTAKRVTAKRVTAKRQDIVGDRVPGASPQSAQTHRVPTHLWPTRFWPTNRAPSRTADQPLRFRRILFFRFTKVVRQQFGTDLRDHS